MGHAMTWSLKLTTNGHQAVVQVQSCRFSGVPHETVPATWAVNAVLFVPVALAAMSGYAEFAWVIVRPVV